MKIKNVLASGFVLSMMVLPVVALAAPSDVDPNPPTSECVSLQNNLRYKSRDVNTNGEVSDLQDFLQSKGYLSSEPTGYFGLLTLKATKDFQSANSIQPTGYVGSITRAKIASLTNCGTMVTPPTVNASEHIKCLFNGSSNQEKCYTATDNPSLSFYCSGIEACVANVNGPIHTQLTWKSSCGGYAYTTIDGNNKYANFNCSTNNNQPPVITSVGGPTSLNVNETGTWTVRAYDPDGTYLNYSVDFGDVYAESTISPSPNQIANTQTSTFTHNYSQAGNYKVVFTVSDNAGSSIQSSITVIVGQTNASASITVLSPNGGEVFHQGDQMLIYWKSSGNIPIVDINVGTYLPSVGNPYFVSHPYVAQGIANSGSFTWSIPFDFPIGANYVIWIGIPTGSSTRPSDQSDRPFSIVGTTTTQASITVAPPIAGAFPLHPGDAVTISYKANAGNISFYYEGTGGQASTFIRTVNLVMNNGGGDFQWTVPSGVSGNLRIRGSSNGSDGNFYSAPFSVVSTTPPPPPSTASINVFSPASGEVWQTGKTYSVNWVYSGPTDCNISVILYDTRDSQVAYGGNYLPLPVSTTQYSFSVPQNVFPGTNVFKVQVIATKTIGDGSCGLGQSNTFSIIAPAGTGQAPTASLSISPGTVVAGQNITYNWSSTNATSWSWSMYIKRNSDGATMTSDPCNTQASAWQGPPGGNSASGSWTGATSACQAGYTYYIVYNAQNSSGIYAPAGDNNHVTLNVTAPTTTSSCTINSFTASPSTVTAGQSSTLSWSTSGCTYVSSPNFGDLSLSGTRPIYPTTTTTYTLNASNQNTPANGTSASVTVTVNSAQNASFSFTPNGGTLVAGRNAWTFSLYSANEGDILSVDAKKDELPPGHYTICTVPASGSAVHNTYCQISATPQVDDIGTWTDTVFINGTLKGTISFKVVAQ